MPIKIKSSGGGSVSFDAPNTGSDYTLTVPAETGTVITTSTGSGINAAALTVSTLPKSVIPTGGVLQVVNAIKTDVASQSSSTWADISGLSASITPRSTSNKILIFISIGYSGWGASPGFRILRDSTVLTVGDAGGGSRVSAWHGSHWSTGTTNVSYLVDRGTLVHLDSPSSTSATTYKLQWANFYTNYITLNGNYADVIGGDSSGYQIRSVSTLTLMEIAG